MREVRDQMGLRVVIPLQPKRMVSLVPSQTELLFDLGLDEEIVGVTRFCIHPAEKISQKTRIGGTKDFDLEKIMALKPDLIIGNKEENYIEGIEELKRHFPVWMSDIFSLDDAYNMMRDMGEMTSKQAEAEVIIVEIKARLSQPSLATRPSPLLSCAYFIWRKPYMVAAGGTFIDHMMGVLGVRNAFAELERYPEVRAEQIAGQHPDLIFLSSEPYAFRERHVAEFRTLCPDAKVIIVDGELFSWYGSRLRHTAGYFKELRGEIEFRISDF